MNRGNIPGYYFDEEKKKYFKIQANHVAPKGAKYAKSNVKREKYVAKKQKLAQRKQNALRQQTVQRSRILASAVTGSIALRRELVLDSSASRAAHRDAAFVSQLAFSSTRILDSVSPAHTAVLLRYHVLRDTPYTLLCSRFRDASCFLSKVEWDLDAEVDERAIPALPTWIRGVPNQVSHLSSFHHVASLSSSVLTTSLDGNVFLGRVSHTHTSARGGGVYLQACSGESTLWGASINPDEQYAALATSHHVGQLDLVGRPVSHLTSAAEVYSVDWLSRSTIVASADNAVLLWDTRAQGSSERFRHPARISGIKKENEHQLLVSSNKLLSLYDVRMPPKLSRRATSAVFSMPLLHEGPTLVFDSNKSGLVAAYTNAKDGIGVYSLRTGALVRNLRLPADYQVTQVSWDEDSRGAPLLRACQNECLLKWAWSYPADEG